MGPAVRPPRAVAIPPWLRAVRGECASRTLCAGRIGRGDAALTGCWKSLLTSGYEYDLLSAIAGETDARFG